eukprot:CAMPEP_0119385292 /NCGR_PEP_ID=MMETSP1334-20130426/90431_1 /TAXON_ID=127549 /ORGANISM="Calcidiscus leptoporus, Strain RCC1130" /LENGTH=70 /DNA_ID=CAMNT_0007406549 /DNA_START=457 /DNA_END=670 /DNA_ORIENTATION=-
MPGAVRNAIRGGEKLGGRAGGVIMLDQLRPFALPVDSSGELVDLTALDSFDHRVVCNSGERVERWRLDEA